LVVFNLAVDLLIRDEKKKKFYKRMNGKKKTKKIKIPIKSGFVFVMDEDDDHKNK